MATERQRDSDNEHDDTKVSMSAGGKVVETTLGAMKNAADAMDQTLAKRRMVLQIPDPLKGEKQARHVAVDLGPEGEFMDLDLVLRLGGEEFRVTARVTAPGFEAKRDKHGFLEHTLTLKFLGGYGIAAVNKHGEVVDRYTYGELQPEPTAAKTPPLNFTAH